MSGIHSRILSASLLLLLLILGAAKKVSACPLPDEDIPTPQEVINAVNTLRANYGLAALNSHTALMQSAQIEAEGIANGMPGHWRPNGITLGQWLMSLGYPLAGDLSLDGYRSENWIALPTAQEAIQAWLGDEAHKETMLSPDRSDIGVGIAISGDQVFIVLVTALQTRDGKMQSDASDILSQADSSESGTTEGATVSQYINAVVLSTADLNGDVVHKIQYGQSLWSIAVAYQTTIDQIRAWNNLGEENTVYEGQILLVQRSATQPPTATLTPRVSATPLSTPTLRQPASTSTLTVTPSSMNPIEESSLKKSFFGIKEGLILLLVAITGLMVGWSINKKS